MFTKETSARAKFFAGAAGVGAMLLLASSRLLRADGTVQDGFTERFAEVNGARLRYLLGGKGTPVVLLHDYAEGEKAGGAFLIEQVKLVASVVKGEVVQGSGHWLMEEAPQTVIPAIIDFID